MAGYHRGENDDSKESKDQPAAKRADKAVVLTIEELVCRANVSRGSKHLATAFYCPDTDAAMPKLYLIPWGAVHAVTADMDGRSPIAVGRDAVRTALTQEV